MTSALQRWWLQFAICFITVSTRLLMQRDLVPLAMHGWPYRCRQVHNDKCKVKPLLAMKRVFSYSHIQSSKTEPYSSQQVSFQSQVLDLSHWRGRKQSGDVGERLAWRVGGTTVYSLLERSASQATEVHLEELPVLRQCCWVDTRRNDSSVRSSGWWWEYSSFQVCALHMFWQSVSSTGPWASQVQRGPP